jgi:hypothetical protein
MMFEELSTQKNSKGSSNQKQKHFNKKISPGDGINIGKSLFKVIIVDTRPLLATYQVEDPFCKPSRLSFSPSSRSFDEISILAAESR